MMRSGNVGKAARRIHAVSVPEVTLWLAWMTNPDVKNRMQILLEQREAQSLVEKPQAAGVTVHSICCSAARRGTRRRR